MRVITLDGALVALVADEAGDGAARVRTLDGEEHSIAAARLDGGIDVERASVLAPVEACPLCDAPSARHAFSVRQFFWDVQVVECDRCGHVYKREIPSPQVLDRTYSSDYVHFRPAPPTEHELVALAPRVRRLGRPRGARRHLDFGCGAGAFVAAARRAGWDSLGVDPFLPALPESHPLRAYLVSAPVDTLDQFGRFDAISLWAAVEHFPDPGRTLARLAERLAPGGSLVFNSPNGRSLVAQRQGSHWTMAVLVEHLSFFTPRSVRWLADGLGLRIESLRRSGSPYPFGRTRPSQGAQGVHPAQLGLRPTPAPAPTETRAAPPSRSPLRWLSAVGQAPQVAAWLRPVVARLHLGDHLDVRLTRR